GDVLQNTYLAALMKDAFKAANNPRLWRLVTPYSMDLDRPGAAPGQAAYTTPNFSVNPYTLDPNAQPHLRYPTALTGLPTSYAGTGFGPFINQRVTTPAPGGDF